MTTYYLIWFIGGDYDGRQYSAAFCTNFDGVEIFTDLETAQEKFAWFNDGGGHWAGSYRIIEVREDEL